MRNLLLHIGKRRIVTLSLTAANDSLLLIHYLFVVIPYSLFGFVVRDDFAMMQNYHACTYLFNLIEIVRPKYNDLRVSEKFSHSLLCFIDQLLVSY